MDINNNNAITTIAESIVTACRELISKAQYDKTITSTVITAPDSRGYYGLIYNGNRVYVPNYSGREININDTVMVTLPGNNYREMFISSVLTDVQSDSGSGGGGSSLTTDNYDSLSNRPRINGVTLTGNKSLSALGIVIPTSTRELTNNSGFITSSDIPHIPVNISELINDSGYITSGSLPDIPSKVSDLTNDIGFITANDVASAISIPAYISELVNDSGFITRDDVPQITNIPTKTSDLVNDSGFITSSSLPSVPTRVSQLSNDAGYITAANIPATDAAHSAYNNTVSGLQAQTTQAAIDEVVSMIGEGGSTPIVIGDDYVSKDEFVQFVNMLIEELDAP